MRQGQREYAWAFTFASIVAIFAAVVLWNMGRERVSSNEFSLAQAGNEVSFEEAKGDLEDVTGALEATADRVAPDRVEKPSSPALRIELDKPIASAPVGEPGSPEARPATVTDYIPQGAGNQGSSDHGRTEAVRASEPSGYARSSGRTAAAPTLSAPGGSGPVGAAASAAAVSGGAQPTDGPARAETQNTSHRAKLNELADSSAAAADEGGASPSSGPSTSNRPPEAVASPGIVNLPSAAVDAAFAPALVSSSALIDSADPGRGELLAESVLANAGLVESPSDYNNPIKVIQESMAAVETPVATVANAPTVNPEPASLLLLGSGLALIARRMRRREPVRGK